MLTPTPTPEQVETTREMMGENSYSRVESLILAGNDAQWVRTLDDIDEWDAQRTKYARLTGRVELDPADRRRDIRARVRLRYGLTERVDGSVTGQRRGSVAVPVEVYW